MADTNNKIKFKRCLKTNKNIKCMRFEIKSVFNNKYLILKSFCFDIQRKINSSALLQSINENQYRDIT